MHIPPLGGGYMKKRFYLVPLVLLLLGLLVPAIYTNKSPKYTLTGEHKAAVRVSPAPAGKSPDVTNVGKERKNKENTLLAPRERADSSSDAAAKTAPAKSAGKEKKEPAAPGLSPPPAGLSEPGGVAVGIAVVGKDNELLYGPAEVRITEENRWGVTALGALDATGLRYTVSARYPDFVDSIAGQYNHGQSGWMYKVNDETPLVAAAKKPLNREDKVIWWYSKGMNVPPPAWDELVKRKD